MTILNKKFIIQKEGFVNQVIHLSDIHIGADASNGKSCLENFITICNHIAFMGNTKNTVVVITGDILDEVRGKYEKQFKKILRTLKKNVLDVIIVPGNHDYSPKNLLTKITKKLAGVYMLKRTSKQFSKKFNLPLYNQYPITYMYPESKVAFTVLDSNAGELGFLDHISAEGELGKKQLNRLEESHLNNTNLKGYQKFLLLHHHAVKDMPFHQLKDKKDFQKIIMQHNNIYEDILAILCGHNHKDYAKNEQKNGNPLPGISLIYAANTSTAKGSEKEGKAEEIPHRFIDLKKGIVREHRLLSNEPRKEKIEKLFSN